MAFEKAEFGWKVLQQTGRDMNGRAILTADTSVVFDQEILGKPNDADNAKAMLNRLSGNSHQVVTSVGLKSHDGFNIKQALRQ